MGSPVERIRQGILPLIVSSCKKWKVDSLCIAQTCVQLVAIWFYRVALSIRDPGVAPTPMAGSVLCAVLVLGCGSSSLSRVGGPVWGRRRVSDQNGSVDIEGVCVVRGEWLAMGAECSKVACSVLQCM